MKKVAIVILNWNGASMMRRFLPSVIEHSAEVADIVVADNAHVHHLLPMIRWRCSVMSFLRLEP